MAYKRLGDMLIDNGVITEDQLMAALAAQKGTGRRLGQVLVQEKVCTEADIIDTLCMQLGIDFVDLSHMTLPAELTNFVPKNIAKKYDIVPVRATPDELYLAMADPMNFEAQEAARAASRRRIIPMVSNTTSIDRAIMQLYGNEGAARAIEDMRNEALLERTDDSPSFETNTLDSESDAQSAPTIRLVNSIIERGATERASDIHLSPREADMQVRMRIDGLMRNVLTVPRDLQGSVISRLKIMGGMNIAERRVPQDGRSNVRIKNRDIDLRISTLPTIYGENVVIRLLDKSTQLFNPAGIGLRGEHLRLYKQLTSLNNGVILITGPTGSGKSSTMYTMMKELNTETVNMITLEDPVEYNMDGINQVQIDEKTGLTFASGLRSILRQDPDIVAVGEIRDGETAEIAMRAAITGHVVLSTIHTFDSISTIDRLLDIGVQRYLISSALRGVISQRLVRTVCPRCREEYTPTEEEMAGLEGMFPADAKFYHGAGCPMCFHTGYRGRTAVFEIMMIGPEMRRGIMEGLSREDLRVILDNTGFQTLSKSVIDLVVEGTTTLEEAKRTINSLD
ncbi:MAG: ATPase, T2SS/T4P/T4SS family [Coriobacteriia bacterium]|nr:ATPase, T2SS/T4P/T4SS family [Coriobacteriia bacterium]